MTYKTNDEFAAAIIAEMKELGLEAFEAKQIATNPYFYKSGINEMPDFEMLRKRNDLIHKMLNKKS